MRRLLVMVCVLVPLPGSAFAQSRDSTKGSVDTQPPVPSCCAIVRIEADKSLATAREIATGFTFRFSVKSRRLLGTLKVGQPVWVDFAAKTVKLKATDSRPCCAIVDTPPAPLSLGDARHYPASGLRKETS